jgi:hypothetical protein
MVRFQVLTVESMKMTGRQSGLLIALMMKAVRTSEM